MVLDSWAQAIPSCCVLTKLGWPRRGSGPASNLQVLGLITSLRTAYSAWLVKALINLKEEPALGCLDQSTLQVVALLSALAEAEWTE